MTEQHMHAMEAYHYDMVQRLERLPGMLFSKQMAYHSKRWEAWADALYYRVYGCNN